MDLWVRSLWFLALQIYKTILVVPRSLCLVKQLGVIQLYSQLMFLGITLYVHNKFTCVITVCMMLTTRLAVLHKKGIVSYQNVITHCRNCAL